MTDLREWAAGTDATGHEMRRVVRTVSVARSTFAGPTVRDRLARERPGATITIERVETLIRAGSTRRGSWPGSYEVTALVTLPRTSETPQT